VCSNAAGPRATTLLLIEDHPDIAEMIAEYLEQRGYAIDHAADGLTGLHLAVTNHYDVIIADVMLAGMDGITLCRKLREEARRDTPSSCSPPATRSMTSWPASTRVQTTTSSSRLRSVSSRHASVRS